MKKIAYCLDLNQFKRNKIDHLIEIINSTQNLELFQEIHLCTIIHPAFISYPFDAYIKQRTKIGADVLSGLTQLQERLTGKVIVKILESHTSGSKDMMGVLDEYCEARGIVNVAVIIQKRGFLYRSFFGSFATAALNTLKRNIIVYPMELDTKHLKSKKSKLVVCVDILSLPKMESLKPILALLKNENCTLDIVYVSRSNEYKLSVEEGKKYSDFEKKTLLSFCKKLDTKARPIILAKSRTVAKTLQTYTAQSRPKMVVVPQVAHGSVMDIVMGSTTEEILGTQDFLTYLLR